VFFYLETTYNAPIVTISSIENTNIEERVAISGKVIKQTLVNGNLFFTLKDNTTTINAIIFGTEKKINNNKVYTFEGKLTSYQNKLELIVEKFYNNQIN